MTAINGAPVTRTRREAIAARKKEEARKSKRLQEAAANVLALSSARADESIDPDRRPDVITLDVPSDPSAEAFVIATAMTGTPEQREAVLTRVPAEHMHHERHRQVYEGLLRMHADGVDFDPRTLCIREPKLDPHYVESLWIFDAPRVENLEIAIAALAEDALRRTIINDAVAPLIESVSDQRAPIDRVTELARTIVDKVEAQRTTTGATSLQYSDLRAAYANVGAERAWTVEGVFSGAPLIVIAGPEKSGKSWKVADLVLAMTTGSKWLGRFQAHTEGHGNVVDSEYGDEETARRKVRLARGRGMDPYAVLDRIRHYPGHDFYLDMKCEAVGRLLADVKANPPVLTVIDPLRNFLGDGDENSNKDILKALGVCARIRDASKAPVVVVHHLNKSGSTTGARAIRTRADIIIEGTDEDEPFYTAVGRTIRSTDAIRNKYTLEIVHTDDENEAIATTRVVAHFEGDKRKPAGLSTTAKKLVAAMKKHGAPLTSNKLGTLTNTNGTVRARALQELRDRRLVTVLDSKWSLTKEAKWQDTVAAMRASRGPHDLDIEADDCEPDDEDREPDDEEGDQDAGAIF